MKISVVGAGYVGLSLSVLLSRRYEVITVDIVENKVGLINQNISPISDKDIEFYLQSGKLNLTATTDIRKIRGSDYVIVATPTNYDPETKHFDTSSVSIVIDQIMQVCPDATIVIKSTIPIGFTEKLCSSFGYSNVIFSPEFLREGKALYDNLHPSRIIVGCPSGFIHKENACNFLKILNDCAITPAKTMLMGSTEAESVKLFSNTYLALRISYFNELDTFAEKNNLATKDIIAGVCSDPRIGDWYNNPSFGYGGYCLPKDSKQLLYEFHDVPNALLDAIVKSNYIRKEHIVNQVLNKINDKGVKIGIYRLIMKKGSDNFRESSIIDIMDILKQRGFSLIIYEPTLEGKFENISVERDLSKFIQETDIILANRLSQELVACAEKVYTRDIFSID